MQRAFPHPTATASGYNRGELDTSTTGKISILFPQLICETRIFTSSIDGQALEPLRHLWIRSRRQPHPRLEGHFGETPYPVFRLGHAPARLVDIAHHDDAGVGTQMQIPEVDLQENLDLLFPERR